MLAQQVLGLPSAGSGGENHQPGLLLGGARLCWLPSCASCASQTSHSICASCASCASCARARLSSSRPARSCHIPNLTAPSVGISSNLSARMQKRWQCHFFFFKAVSRWKVVWLRGYIPPNRRLASFVFLLEEPLLEHVSWCCTDHSSAEDSFLVIFFQKKWEEDGAGCTLRSDVRVDTRLL